MKIRKPLLFSSLANNQLCNVVRSATACVLVPLSVKEKLRKNHIDSPFLSKTHAFQKVLKNIYCSKNWYHRLEGILWRKALWVLWTHAPSMHTSPSFSAQISPAWGPLHWRRGFQMSTWKGKRTPECWSTSGFRYSHVDQKHAWGISRKEPPTSCQWVFGTHNESWHCVAMNTLLTGQQNTTKCARGEKNPFC